MSETTLLRFYDAHVQERLQEVLVEVDATMAEIPPKGFGDIIHKAGNCQQRIRSGESSEALTYNSLRDACNLRKSIDFVFWLHEPTNHRCRSLLLVAQVDLVSAQAYETDYYGKTEVVTRKFLLSRVQPSDTLVVHHTTMTTTTSHGKNVRNTTTQVRTTSTAADLATYDELNNALNIFQQLIRTPVTD